MSQQASSSSSSSDPLLVWFQLYDAANGQPYKGSTADAVSLSPRSMIVQFRDAVKAKYDVPGYLRDIPASTLLVYKNKAAFDKRNAAEDQGKENPLKVDAAVGGLGTSEDDALVVVVPSANQVRLLVAEMCSVPFFNNVCNATVQGECILFEDNIPYTPVKTLYIRSCYETIGDSIKSGINKVIITGTPGIGKSLFLFYHLYNLVKKGKRVLFIYHPWNIYYDGKGGVLRLPSLPIASDISFWNESLYCLFDAKSRTEYDLNKLPYEHCNFILSSSPRRQLVNDYKKPPSPQVFFMPPWTEAEMNVIAPLFPDAVEWHNRFTILGGIPRHVLEVTERDPTKMLEAACADCKLDKLLLKIGINSEFSEKSKVVHCLVHVTSSPPFTESSVCFASQTALNIIVREMGSRAKYRLREMLEAAQGNPIAAALCGNIFEPYAIELLEQGGNFTCRRLVHGNSLPSQNTTLTIPSSTKIVVERVDITQTANQLYVPKTSNYTAIDAWIPGIGAFQMTVGKSHNIKGGAKDDLALLGTGANKLYWLLPPLYFHSFTKKTPQEIEQIALLIPYPQAYPE